MSLKAAFDASAKLEAVAMLPANHGVTALVEKAQGIVADDVPLHCKLARDAVDAHIMAKLDDKQDDSPTWGGCARRLLRWHRLA